MMKQKYGGYLLYAIGIVAMTTSVLEKRSMAWILLSVAILCTGSYFLTKEK